MELCAPKRTSNPRVGGSNPSGRSLSAGQRHLLVTDPRAHRTWTLFLGIWLGWTRLPRITSFGKADAVVQSEAESRSLCPAVLGDFIAAVRHALASGSHRCKGRDATIVGRPVSERIEGTDRSDVIVAGSGNDVVTGHGMNRPGFHRDSVP